MGKDGFWVIVSEQGKTLSGGPDPMVMLATTDTELFSACGLALIAADYTSFKLGAWKRADLDAYNANAGEYAVEVDDIPDLDTFIEIFALEVPA